MSAYFQMFNVMNILIEKCRKQFLWATKFWKTYQGWIQLHWKLFLLQGIFSEKLLLPYHIIIWTAVLFAAGSSNENTEEVTLSIKTEFTTEWKKWKKYCIRLRSCIPNTTWYLSALFQRDSIFVMAFQLHLTVKGAYCEKWHWN